MLRVLLSLASVVQYLEHTILLFVTLASDLPLRTIKCYSVVFGITLRVLVINISSSISHHQKTPPLTATSDECHQLAIVLQHHADNT